MHWESRAVLMAPWSKIMTHLCTDTEQIVPRVCTDVLIHAVESNMLTFIQHLSYLFLTWEFQETNQELPEAVPVSRSLLCDFLGFGNQAGHQCTPLLWRRKLPYSYSWVVWRETKLAALSSSLSSPSKPHLRELCWGSYFISGVKFFPLLFLIRWR